MNSKRLQPIRFIVATSLAISAAASAPCLAQAGPPDWFRGELQRMVNDGDRWITDNSAYVSAQEPWTEYGMEWGWAIDGVAISGRLFGLLDGREVTFWDFRMYWDGAARKAMLVQIGTGGRIGEGSVSPTGNPGESESDQTFRAPDGTTMRVRHLSTTTADTHTTRSFDRVGDHWEERRTYVWKRTKKQTP